MHRVGCDLPELPDGRTRYRFEYYCNLKFYSHVSSLEMGPLALFVNTQYTII